jgi:threonine/homoserine/homoserine lactone efflux protein
MKLATPVFGGFKLGLLLQLGGIGPICVLLFQLPAFLSLSSVLLGVLGVTLADAIYIGLAALGIAPLVQRIKATDKGFKIISGVFLVLLGLFFISMIWNESQAMSVVEWLNRNIFWGLFILTMMNPATIVIFTGIFTAELIDRKLKAKELFWFAVGVILTTPIFLGLVAIMGSLSSHFLPSIVIKVLNATVGCALIYWGLTHFSQKLKIKMNITSK